MNNPKEQGQPSARGIWAASLAMFVLLFILVAILWPVQKGLRNTQPPVFASSPRRQLEFESGDLVHALKSKQRAELETIRWTDDKEAFAEVPIESAMQEIARGKSFDPFALKEAP